MAILINGDGNEAVYAAQDADWYASIMGNVTAITGVGQQFESNLEDANTISVSDGVIITKEGRRIQLDTDEVDVFGIPTGTQDSTNYYIIGYELSIDDNSNQICNTFVEKMDSASATIPEETFKGGATSVMVSLYRVTQAAMTITSIDLLLPKITDIKSISESISQINNDLLNLEDVSSLFAMNTTLFSVSTLCKCYKLGNLIFATFRGTSAVNAITASTSIIVSFDSSLKLRSFNTGSYINADGESLHVETTSISNTNHTIYVENRGNVGRYLTYFVIFEIIE